VQFQFRILSLALCVWITSCVKHASNHLPSAPPAEDTALGAGDEFEVRVFGEKDLTGTHQVAPDGTIQFPFLGTVSVSGKETTEVAKTIADGLSTGGYLKDPQVSVFLTKSNSKRISVLGAVAKPGTFPIVPGLSLVNAVSEAGGFTALASKDDTVVTRRVNGKLERYRVPVTKITRGDSSDFPLRAGDIVFVPERVF
jgi:polysaccharide export outer membrane protein